MKDPVCGMDVSEDAEAVTGPDGKTHRFCCAACRWAFERDPERFSRP